MRRLDPTRTWAKAEERLGQETDPRRRRLLENVLAHLQDEAACDVPGLMATLAPDELPEVMSPAPKVGA